MPQADRTMEYLRDPAEIYRRSFAAIRAEARLEHLPADMAGIAVRLIHACGMTDIAGDLAFTADVANAAQAALRAGAPILCDSSMTAEGIIAHRLPAANPVLCTLRAPETAGIARARATTHSAAAVELWRPHLAGSVVAIGNAPTALYALLELLDAGAPKPAAVFAFPVGFIGAAESKAELARDGRGVPFLTLHGRRGGSALAAAAINALCAGPPS